MNKIDKLVDALTKSTRVDYEKLRGRIIEEEGYDSFRELQKEAFKKLK